ncbi:MAG: hypothetical protein U0905_19165 [Pirellulales bacterium]
MDDDVVERCLGANTQSARTCLISIVELITLQWNTTDAIIVPMKVRQKMRGVTLG